MQRESQIRIREMQARADAMVKVASALPPGSQVFLSVDGGGGGGSRPAITYK